MSDRAKRKDLIERLEQARGGTAVISYITSTRANLEAQMAMDVIPIIHRHLVGLGASATETRLDLFLHSNGGDGIVPWRLVCLLREYCKELAVLVPNRAFSAATLTALGADKVVMHPMGMLGPIDPSVTTPFNPQNPLNPGQLYPVSVEDVASYINLVKTDVGIRHEDELVQAFVHLAEKVHPLALGSVKRATAQSRMMGEKLLRQRQAELGEHDLEEILEKLTSQLHFHGHPINRQEAAEDIRLSFVEAAEAETETAMWELYEAYAEEMKLDEEFNPLQDAYAQNPIAPPAPPQFVQGQQVTPSLPTVSTTTLGPIPAAVVESRPQVDIRSATFEVTLRREWTGELNANIPLTAGGWGVEP